MLRIALLLLLSTFIVHTLAAPSTLGITESPDQRQLLRRKVDADKFSKLLVSLGEGIRTANVQNQDAHLSVQLRLAASEADAAATAAGVTAQAAPAKPRISPASSVVSPQSGNATQTVPTSTPGNQYDRKASTGSGTVEQAVSTTTPLPTVTLGPGAIIIGSNTNGIDTFVGIPFAMPPTGTLRLSRPQSYPSSSYLGTSYATNAPTACPQLYTLSDSATLDSLGEETNNLLDSVGAQAISTDEDCLTLTIQRPAGAGVSGPIPVLVYISGGGPNLASDGLFNASSLLQRSSSYKSPIMLVAVNYRIGALGFLAGQQLAAEGSTNLGLRDQEMALQWVQDHISAFGGAPNKVTIWGQSFGAMSVLDQMLKNGDKYFVGAIMDSGSIIPAQDVLSPTAQAIFDAIVNGTGCFGAIELLDCLRVADFSTFQKAASLIPNMLSYSSINLAYLPRPDNVLNNSNPTLLESPDDLVVSSGVPNIPVLCNNAEDEGTIFALSETANSDVASSLQFYFGQSTPKYLADLVKLYTDQSYSSPFDLTAEAGPSTPYPGNGLLAAILGDLTSTMMRRLFLQKTTAPAWSYLDSHLQRNSSLGTFQGSDVKFLLNGDGPAAQVADIQTRYISFVNSQDPNHVLMVGSIKWPEYGTTAQMLWYTPNGVQTRNDEFRKDAGTQIANYRTILRM